ncbi:Sensor protein FixL [Pigmentiphaga humi]|uniref:histidine kinase n=1 Tax=Pigmentiphaga humi TaxID=2478468 RepID=A0A3P4AXL9_9BURK|nr:ATP-binding protein [Pigmentiphaga humi]VCU68824.1 Sensor protein FixL [Pigmentiphaga humi]
MSTLRSARHLLPFAVWLAAAVLAVALVAAFGYRGARTALAERTAEAETRLSERLAQHDAHLTALAAVIRMARAEPDAGVQGLAQAVRTFYPRITDIDVIRPRGELASVAGYGGVDGPTAGTLPGAALPPLSSPGETAIHARADRGGYDLVKLVAPGVYLRLRIDAAALIAGLAPADYGAVLRLDQRELARAGPGAQGLAVIGRGAEIASASQPLRLEISRRLGAWELLRPAWTLPLLLGLALAVWLAAQYRRAVRDRREEERRAALLEQEARLAHAGRVNALGEMASGIAHELAQPMAALLTQSQAARRAAAQGRQDLLQLALDANVREARRAGDILGRMRVYISGDAARLEAVPLADALTEALRLVEPDLARRGIALRVSLPNAPCGILIDVIAFQQVIVNLVLNAAEALAAGTPAPRIDISAVRQGEQAVITVADNGPGIPPEALPRLFEPFFTTKPDGMGLGLPLCARLAETMHGSVEAANADGACFTLKLPIRMPA